MTKIYIPLDMAAVAMGADRLAAAVAREAAARGQKDRDRPQWLARHVVAGAAGRG